MQQDLEKLGKALRQYDRQALEEYIRRLDRKLLEDIRDRRAERFARR